MCAANEQLGTIVPLSQIWLASETKMVSPNGFVASVQATQFSQLRLNQERSAFQLTDLRVH